MTATEQRAVENAAQDLAEGWVRHPVDMADARSLANAAASQSGENQEWTRAYSIALYARTLVVSVEADDYRTHEEDREDYARAYQG